ncbi:MAG: site-specific recombinase [Burkholderiaceae bacterium]
MAWPWRRGAKEIEAEAPELDALLRRESVITAFSDRVEWLRDALRWIEKDLAAPDDEQGIARAHARVRFLLQLVERRTDAGTRLQASLAGILADIDVEQLAAAGGIPRRGGFIKEIYERLIALVLPASDYQHDAASLAAALIGKPTTLAWLERLPEVDAARLARLFTDPGTAAHLKPQLSAAMLTVASEAQAMGLSHDLRRRFANTSAMASPFGRLVAAVEAFIATPDETYGAELNTVVAECIVLLETLPEQLAATGVSVDLFYRAERTRAHLLRLTRLAEWLRDPEPASVLRQVAAGVRREASLRGVRALWSQNMRLLSRRIAERNAEAGEHYIATSRSQYRTMLLMSAGGGALMAFAVYFKFVITAAPLPLFWEGFLASLNYAGIFVVIALFHFTVATKQPAMTAPALAASMRDLDLPGGVEALVSESAALVRSQVASVFGNLAAVVPAVLAIAFVWWVATDRDPVSVAKVRSVLEAHSILGPSFIFAAYTGVLLWLSGLFSGWADNAFTLRRLHGAIAHRPGLVRRLGEDGARRRADWWQHNIGNLAGNIGLGLLLGLTPVFAAFFGLPLEVRHVTLATGQVAVATFALGPSILTTTSFWLAVAGLALIGVLNVSVSFGLALRVAMRAVDVTPQDRLRVYRAIRGSLARHPERFLWPPRDSAFGPLYDGEASRG